ncbi:hypothetical protein [Mesorhizobium sp. M1374]|uniref:sacsin N-terminal ATP-binding-like domain-containing protein n=1 Tax=Mesorhizobium sp. M1374 TaxID=2957091 RepID=UPI0033363C06
MTRDFADAALEELEHLQLGTPGVLRQVLDGAQISAEQQNVESFHGLIEVVQNADDLGASEVRAAVQGTGGRQKLLVVHDGERVHLEHVIAMTLAFISTKRNDPFSKGRFGIGLKTLGRLGRRLTVHCQPYHFVIQGSQVERAKPRNSIPGLYDSRSNQTLLELDLLPGFQLDEFRNWFIEKGAQSLLFLDAVRHLKLLDLERKKVFAHHEIHVAAIEQNLRLPGVNEPCCRTILKEPATGRSWSRYDIHKKAPRGLQRRYKAIGETTPLSVALPASPDEEGWLYAGLPIGEANRLPFSLHAQFDVDTARRSVQREKLNEWLFARLGEFAAALAVYLFRTQPAEAWKAVPLRHEAVAASERWLSDRFLELTDTIRQKVKRSAVIQVEGAERKLREIVFEDSALTGLIGQGEATGLRPNCVLLPDSCRDPERRWRSVLAELDERSAIDVAESISLFDWQDEDLSHRDVRWFIRLAHVAIKEGEEAILGRVRCIVTDDGARIVPPVAEEDGEMLLSSRATNALVSRLGLARALHPVYLSRWPPAEAVRKWLEQQEHLVDSPEAEKTLEVIAAVDRGGAVLQFRDPELLELRNLFERVPSEMAVRIGPRIGRVIAVEVQSWRERSKQQEVGRPSVAYLPASIEDRADGWSKAAAETPGIFWIHPRYEKLLQRKGQERDDRKSKQWLASRAFFRLLGAEVAPRLFGPGRVEERYGDPAHRIIWSELSDSQRQALQNLSRHATHLKDDWVSPALLAVVNDIAAERKGRNRSVRARALLSTLDREWGRLYSGRVSASAVYSDYTWTIAGTIPATWIAHAMDISWLTSEAGKPQAPRELAVRTPATEAIFGDDSSRFARELDSSSASSPVVSALRVETDPQVTQLLDQLESYRESGEALPQHQFDLRYAAIAAACNKRDPGPDDLVGDITIKQLRARFGAQRNRPGLIFLHGQWLPPARVFFGPSVFGAMRPFVPARSPAAALWRVLRIKPPSVMDCVEILEEIAASRETEPDQQILVETYAYLEAHLAEASRIERLTLARLPLWTGRSWATRRPIYVCDIPGAAEALSRHLPVWRSPIGLEGVPGLVSAMQVTAIPTESFIPSVGQNANLKGAAVEAQVRNAVRLLMEWVARYDRELTHANSVPWDSFARARVAIDPNLQLELPGMGVAPIVITARAHISRDPLTFYFADTDVIGDDEAGLVIASLFQRGDRMKLSLAWSHCWSKAAKGAVATIGIEEDAADTSSLEDLFQQAKGAAPRVRKNRISPKSDRNTPTLDDVPTQAVRRLKTVQQLDEKTVALSEGQAPFRSEGRRRGLLREATSNKIPGVGNGPAPAASPLAYSPKQKEDLALDVLQLAINGEAAKLRDYRHLRGVGADARDKLMRYFEIKAFYGSVPDDVTLTANEADQALKQNGKFFLAVIGGLEQGYETVVKIFPDPFRTLAIKEDSSVRLSGVTRRKAPLEIRFPDLQGK